ncbi:MAG TPA: tryptophan synthase subunit alpha [Bacteroidaceae bacterium]|nr:tryptophan synthase subunit alpha [Bacteroidaceae bacterium]
MNRIDQLFQQKKSGILSIYMTAGYPGLDDTVHIIKYLQKEGVDMVEIGIPFSDPMADGPVIQVSSQKALKNGMNSDLLFEQLTGIRSEVSIPLIMMGYLNPILQYGFENFLMNCRKVGIDGLIIPDLPPEEYELEYREMCRNFGIHFSMLITPRTTHERIEKIVALTEGFLYMVADSSTTGPKGSIKDRQLEYFERVVQMNLDVPRLIGFGISNYETFKTACRYADGAIIGSAFINAIADSANLDADIHLFLRKVRYQK